MAQSLKGINCKSRPKPKSPISYMSTGVLGSLKKAYPMNNSMRNTVRVNPTPTTENMNFTARSNNLRRGFMPIPMKIMVKPVFKWR